MIVGSEIRSITPSGNIYLDSLTFYDAYKPGIAITYVFQGSTGDGANGGATWAANGARTAFNQALASWSAVANVTFIEAAGPYNGFGSTLAYDWVEAFEVLPDDIAGQHDLPLIGLLEGSYNSADDYFTRSPLVAGGLQYSTFVHEIGHGLGLLHPHNDGDEPPNDPAFPGVETSSDFGTFNLNAGIFTVMTYNSGYPEVGYALADEYGWEAGPMAFDIAAVQRLYGANTATNVGATTYVLPQTNGIGTYWSCIWDAGGEDTLSAGAASASAIIDLRAATLLQQPGGGGFVSRIAGVLGGFTIANGAVIENAKGGSGDDRIHGNAAANHLDGGTGYDTVDYSGVTADLVIDLAAGTATGDGADTLVSIEAAIGGAGNDRLVAFAGAALVGDVFKRASQYLNTRGEALDLDYRFRTGASDPTVPSGAGLASVRVRAESSGRSDFYSFFVENPGPVTIDIDNTFARDTVINVYDAAGALLASNDDRNALNLDPGSANFRDSHLLLPNVTAGQRLFVEVIEYDDVAPIPGSSYDLNIVLATSRLADTTRLLGSTLDGGSGDDTLVSGQGDDMLLGGSGDDIAVLSGVRSAYQVSGVQGHDLLFESAADGRDRLIDIELFRFADGDFVWKPGLGLIRDEVAPQIAPIGQLTTAEDTPIQFAVAVTAEDDWHFALGPVPIGTLSAGTNGTLVFTPEADFFGETVFNVEAIGSNGLSSLQSVAVTITPVPDAPRFASPTLTVEAETGRETAVFLDVSDPDDTVPLTLSIGEPAHGTLTHFAGTVYYYQPDDGYLGTDTFTFGATDASGASAQQVVTVNVMPPAPAEWSLYATDGFAGEAGGSGLVFGTNGFQDITVLDRPGPVVFDASFNRGGDIIRLHGNAGGWKAILSGSSAVFSKGDAFVTVPIGAVGTAIAFDDGVRSLRFDQSSGQVKLGGQTVSDQNTAIATASDGTAAPTGASAAAKAAVYIGFSGELTAGGNLEVFGTLENEDVILTQGKIVLDPTFSRGGDTLSLDAPASAFTGTLSGSLLLLDSAGLDVHVPIGSVGMAIAFDGELRTLLYDAGLDAVLLGTQAIGASAAPLVFG